MPALCEVLELQHTSVQVEAPARVVAGSDHPAGKLQLGVAHVDLVAGERRRDVADSGSERPVRRGNVIREPQRQCQIAFGRDAVFERQRDGIRRERTPGEIEFPIAVVDGTAEIRRRIAGDEDLVEAADGARDSSSVSCEGEELVAGRGRSIR